MVTKIDLTDVTVIMPIRIDSQVRLGNLNVILGYLTDNANVQMIVLEADTIRQAPVLNHPDILYLFHKDDDPVFHHTRYRNEMIKTSKTPIIAVWDVDVIAPLDQVLEAVEKIRNQEAVLSWPYNGICYDVPHETGSEFGKSRDMDVLTFRKNDLSPMFGGLTTGGLFFANREKYMKAGMENEHIYGWGPEDAERLKRVTILGLPVHRVRGELYHLWHPRGYNSGNFDPHREMACFKEYLKICRCSRDELLNYIDTWEWIREK